MKSATSTSAPPAPANGSAGGPSSTSTRASAAPSNGTRTSSPAAEAETLRAQILDLVGDYCRVAFPAKDFVGGQSAVPVAGRVFDPADVRSLVDSALDFWLTAGRFSDRFEAEF